MSLRKYILETGFSRHHRYFQIESFEETGDKSKLVYKPYGITVVTGGAAGVRIDLDNSCILLIPYYYC